MCLDWESGDNPAYNGGKNLQWVQTWMDTVEKATGKKPLLYCSPYLISYYSKYKDRIWAAQYASNNVVNGYQATPWNEGAYSCIIRQYTGCGRLNGFNGNLDLDKFYGTTATWDLMVGASTSTAKPQPKPTQQVKNVPNAVYRLCYVSKGLHMYTSNPKERDQLIAAGWKFESVAFYKDDTGYPVYRAYLKSTGDHVFTTNKKEYDQLVANGWKGEGSEFKASKSGKAVYRMYNQKTKQHLYSANKT